MLDSWLNLRLHLGWASQAYSQALPKIDVEPVVIGVALTAIGLIGF